MAENNTGTQSSTGTQNNTTPQNAPQNNPQTPPAIDYGKIQQIAASSCKPLSVSSSGL